MFAILKKLEKLQETTKLWSDIGLIVAKVKIYEGQEFKYQILLLCISLIHCFPDNDPRYISIIKKKSFCEGKKITLFFFLREYDWRGNTSIIYNRYIYETHWGCSIADSHKVNWKTIHSFNKKNDDSFYMAVLNVWSGPAQHVKCCENICYKMAIYK